MVQDERLRNRSRPWPPACPSAHSCLRRYPRPVIEAILDVAARAPSGTNMSGTLARGHVLIGPQKRTVL